MIRKILLWLVNLVKKDRRTFEQKVEDGSLANFHGNNKVRNIFIGKNSYVSYNTIIYNTVVGNYCSVGPNVVIGYGDHPIQFISTSPYIYLNEKLSSKEEINNRLVPHFKKVIIKNDVWVGANVFIRNGVRVGNGAVIGAGSVVLSDVDDYCVVAGVPAKLIKKRFDDEIIDLLLQSEWWELEPDALTCYKDVIFNPSKSGLLSFIKSKYND